MAAYLFKNIWLLFILLYAPFLLQAQLCSKDSNYYSITYQGLDRNHITYATSVSKNEVVSLFRHSAFSDFVTKYTSDGQLIWSNEYLPDYPLEFWWQAPWYERTQMEGLATGKDSTCFLYGSTMEHGTTLNNAGPPTHQAGFYLHLDKSGNIISSRFLGNWFTEYSVNSMIQLPNGNLIVYLRSNFNTYITKLLCLKPDGDLIWATSLKTNFLYKEIRTVNPVMKYLSNGKILVVNEMVRNLDDTLIYPFQPPIIVPAPLHYFHFFTVNESNGQVQEEISNQCPPLLNTNAPADFIPTVKSITELPNGQISVMADMYLPKDNVIFYKQKIYSRSVVNLIVNMGGGAVREIFYQPPGSAFILQSAQSTGNQGEQIVFVLDSATKQTVLFKIGSNGQVQWKKSLSNALGTSNLRGLALEKQDNKGYFIFQSDPDLANFHLSVTNILGNNPCTEIVPPDIIAQDFPWPWFANKIAFENQFPDIDFQISNFKFARKPHPVSKQTNCEYQFICCRDVIDSLHPYNISICPNQTFTLPDQTIVDQAGTYYLTLKTQKGCDSVVYYNIKMLKSPADLTTSPDTCLNGSPVIRLRALPGYEMYWWNNMPTTNTFSEVHAPGVYTVMVENLCGSNTDTIRVYDGCDLPVYFPNAFTPNGDNLNDILKLPSQNRYKLIRLKIFNRWGQMVFITTRPNEGWDGKTGGRPQATGTYVYFLELESLSGKRSTSSGTVLLIR